MARSRARPRELERRAGARRAERPWRRCPRSPSCCSSRSPSIVVVAGGNAVPFLERIQEEHPGDFWSNSTLGTRLAETDDEAPDPVLPGGGGRASRQRLSPTPISAPPWEPRVSSRRPWFSCARPCSWIPTNVQSHYSRSTSFAVEGRYAEAVDELRAAIRLDRESGRHGPAVHSRRVADRFGPAGRIHRRVSRGPAPRSGFLRRPPSPRLRPSRLGALRGGLRGASEGDRDRISRPKLTRTLVARSSTWAGSTKRSPACARRFASIPVASSRGGRSSRR